MEGEHSSAEKPEKDERIMTKTLDELVSHPAPNDGKPNKKMIWIKGFWRVIVDSIQSFIDDECYAKASALTFYSLLSVVPVMAVLFGIAKGFGFQQALESEITQKLAEQPELANKLIQFSYSWLQSVQGGLIAGIGTILLFWSVIGLLNNVEAVLNTIWKTKIARSYIHKITDYLAIVIIAPLFLVSSSSINVFLTTQISYAGQNNILAEAVNPLLIVILKLFPYILSWILFAFVYLFMPNTKVYFRSAIVASLIAGTAFQMWQWIYINFQLEATSYGAIYGSFAALPLFLIWLQISWLILLAGAEIAVQLENDLFIPNRLRILLSTKTAALLITYRSIEAFVLGKKALTDRELAQELGLSLNHVHVLVEVLKNAGILSEVSLSDKTHGYQPARSIQTITMKSVSDAIDRSNAIPASVKDSLELKRIQDYLQHIDQLLDKEEINLKLYP